jgi:hypothetical protein
MTSLRDSSETEGPSEEEEAGTKSGPAPRPTVGRLGYGGEQDLGPCLSSMVGVPEETLQESPPMSLRVTSNHVAGNVSLEESGRCTGSVPLTGANSLVDQKSGSASHESPGGGEPPRGDVGEEGQR